MLILWSVVGFAPTTQPYATLTYKRGEYPSKGDKKMKKFCGFTRYIILYKIEDLSVKYQITTSVLLV